MVIMKFFQCCIVMVQHINPRSNLSRVTALPVLCCLSRQKHLYSGALPKSHKLNAITCNMELARSRTPTPAAWQYLIYEVTHSFVLMFLTNGHFGRGV